MNKVGIIIVSLILAMVVGLSGCAAPVAPLEEAASLEQLGLSEKVDYEVIQLPSEAHLGEYITIKVKVNTPLPPGTVCDLALEHRESARSVHCHPLGDPSVPVDDEGIVYWYAQAPYKF